MEDYTTDNALRSVCVASAFDMPPRGRPRQALYLQLLDLPSTTSAAWSKTTRATS